MRMGARRCRCTAPHLLRGPFLQRLAEVGAMETLCLFLYRTIYLIVHAMLVDLSNSAIDDAIYARAA